MKYQNFKISYGSMEQLYSIVSTAICDWIDQLSLLENAYMELIELESFQATAAQSAKAYLQEVHGTLLFAIREMINNYQAEFLLYKTGFYGIDSNIYACIPEEVVLKVKNTLSSEAVALSTIGQNVESSIDSVSDIFWVGKPTKYALQGVINTFNTDIEEYRLSIDDYEMQKISSYTTTVRPALDAVQATVKDYLNNGTNIASYQAGSIIGNTYMLDLCAKVQSCTEQVVAKDTAIGRAAKRQGEVYEQMQKDFEEACEARKDQGVSQMIMGGFTVVAGTAAIVLTAGMATPVVATAVVTGSCTVAYGISNICEGADEYEFGCNGDLESIARNPIRDTVFAGNQKLYDTWGSLNMTVAMCCAPAGRAINSVAGSTTSVVVKSAAKSVGTELAKDKAFDFASGHVVGHVAEKVDLSRTERTLLNLGVNMLLDKGADAVGKAFTGSDGKLPTDKMTYEEAKRYNIENGLVKDAKSDFNVETIDYAKLYATNLEKGMVELAAQNKATEINLKRNMEAAAATGPKIEDPGIAKDGAKIEGAGDSATTVTGPKVENPGVAKDGVQIENAGDAATTATSGPKIEEPGVVKDGIQVEGDSDTVTYRRVQGGSGNNASQVRIEVNADGTISIPNKDANLSISIDGGEHAEYFLNKRGGDAQIIEVDVPKWFDDFLQKNAIPQVNYKTNPLNQGGAAPKITDITTPGNCFELPAPWIEWLEEYGGNARIVNP